MKRSRFLPAFLLCLFVSAICDCAFAQEPPRKLRVVSGVVIDGDDKQPLRAAKVKVIGKKVGTLTSIDGRFQLTLVPGKYVLAFSMVGYETEKVEVDLTESNQEIKVLMRAPTYDAEEVAVFAEDPGVTLIKEALKRKKRQNDSLQSYRYMLYTKFVASTDSNTANRASGKVDTTIVSIFESYSKGYYKKPDKHYNVIVQRRQSANVPQSANFVVFGTNLNAYDDYIEILGQEVATPFHPDALDFYDFTLGKRIGSDSSRFIRRLFFKPKTNQRKLFEGYVDMDMDKNIPLQLEMKPNRAVRLPFDASLVYRQQFDEFENFYVMPVGMQIQSSAEAAVLFVISPRIDIDIETVAYDYRFNERFPDELFSRRRVDVSKDADKLDSSYWGTNAVLPLRPEETYAYRAIEIAQDNPDSAIGIVFFNRLIAPVARVIRFLNTRPFTGIDDLFHYNRVQGAYLGLGLEEKFWERFVASAAFGYGFADKRANYDIRFRYVLREREDLFLNLKLYRLLLRRDNPYVVGVPLITTLSLLNKNDYGDYYYGSGFELSGELGFGQLIYIQRDDFMHPTIFKLFFRNELQTSASVNANFAFFGGERAFRENPPIFNGTMRSFGFDAQINYSPIRRIANFGFQIKGEFSKPTFIPSDFDFAQYYAALLWRTRTLVPLWRMDMRLSAGYSTGGVPPQRFFSLESAVGGTASASAGVFRGMRVKEFYGDRFFSLSLEHNFGEIIPGAFRIPNIASFGIEFIFLGGIGWSEFSKRTLEYSRTTLPTTTLTSEKWYYEVGFGLNQILIILRTDFSLRLSQTRAPILFFTISTATL
ncbi:MAG: DUF5686 and carboxypeptidase regulatory-like domain-containing protein [Chloroherpetonaceae bacterium]|nr:DUF5686 and carboxypeptidase regulatory-like domain-containing protein [Chloroherpetonaceae bacterium]MDW8436623.1 DUF5686 family protein [Chloroherpetonaceae bacterium]